MFPLKNSIPCFSAISVAIIPWLSTQGNIFSGCRHGPFGQAHLSQIAQASVDKMKMSSVCRLIIFAVCRVISSWGKRVASVSSMLEISVTSVTVVIMRAFGYRKHRILHSSTVPTAGGHAHDLLYIGHSCSQTVRIRSEKTSSAVSMNSYWHRGSILSSSSNCA